MKINHNNPRITVSTGFTNLFEQLFSIKNFLSIFTAILTQKKNTSRKKNWVKDHDFLVKRKLNEVPWTSKERWSKFNPQNKYRYHKSRSGSGSDQYLFAGSGIFTTVPGSDHDNFYLANKIHFQPPSKKKTTGIHFHKKIISKYIL